MACLLDGVKCEGRVGMSLHDNERGMSLYKKATKRLASYFNSSNAKKPGSEITPEEREELKGYCILLKNPFLGKGRGERENEITYKYRLDISKLKAATLIEIVQGIEEFETRDKTTNILKADNPSIKIELFPTTPENIGNAAAIQAVNKDIPVMKFEEILTNFKVFINTLKGKTFKGNPVMETTLHDLTYKQASATTPKRQKHARNPFPDQDQDQAQDQAQAQASSSAPAEASASAPAPASLGGRRTKRRHTKRRHTKRHHRTKHHHTKRVKRSKRSKHTKRRKH
jgi:hypothetical protein